MIIFAHKGLEKERPENTLLAFEMAFLAGFGIECDIRMTKDKKIVIIHDKDPWRITGIHGDVSKMNLHELQKLDFGAFFDSSFIGIKIATLEEVCNLITQKLPDGQKVAFHLKEEEQNDKLLKLVSDVFEKFDLYQKAFLFDFTLNSVKNLKKINTKIKVALSVGEDNYTKTIFKWDQLKKDLDYFDYVWLDEWMIDGSVYNKHLVYDILKSGKKIYAISPELHKEHRHPKSELGFENVWINLIDWGVSGICTTHPIELLKTCTNN